MKLIFNFLKKILRNFFNDWIIPLIIAIIIVVPFRYFILEPYMVQGTSMVPNFHSYDYILVNKMKHWIGDYKRGDVVVLVPPSQISNSWKIYFPVIDPREKYIKRIVGLPGETLKIQDQRLWVKKVGSNKFEKISEPYTNNFGRMSDMEIKLNNNQYFVLGDNRLVSADSRVFGPILKSEILGEPILRIFPIDKFGLYPGENY